MMAWANNEPTQHLALYSDKKLNWKRHIFVLSDEINLPSEMRYDFWANVFAGTYYGISMLTSSIYSVAGSDNQSNKNLGDGIWHG